MSVFGIEFLTDRLSSNHQNSRKRGEIRLTRNESQLSKSVLNCKSVGFTLNLFLKSGVEAKRGENWTENGRIAYAQLVISFS